MAVIDGKWLSKEGLTYFWSKIKAIFTKQTETNVIANLGAKNVLKNVRTTTTHKGVTFTVNEDGSVTASGTNDGTGASLFNINTQTSLALSSGDYILTGCPAGGSETGYFMDVTRKSGASLKDTGSGVGFTVGGTYTVNEFRIVISRSISVSGLVFKPMIRPAKITDSTFQPYAPTNRELYETKTEQTETNVIANLGAKNLLNNQYLATASGTGVTIIDNNDGTYNLSGTATGTATYLYTSSANVSSLYGTETGKSYTITAGSNKVFIRIDYSTNGTSWDNGEDKQPLISNVAGEATFTVPASTIGLYIRFRSTASHGSLNGVVLKPMLRRAEITDDTFQPYAPTNRELYETRFASKTILPDNVDLNNIKTGGIYNGVNSTGNSAVHMPVATGSFNFVLTVIEANEFIIQIFKQLNSAGDPNFYVRRFYIYNSDWDSWYQFTGTQV